MAIENENFIRNYSRLNWKGRYVGINGIYGINMFSPVPYPVNIMHTIDFKKKMATVSQSLEIEISHRGILSRIFEELQFLTTLFWCMSYGLANALLINYDKEGLGLANVNL